MRTGKRQADMRADAALRQVLLAQLAAMEVGEAGILAARDAEYLHDFRVAVRRSRAVLGQIKDVIPPRTLNGFKRGLRQLGLLTGPARDLDVLLEMLATYRQALSTKQRDALAPLHTLLTDRRQQARQALARYLRSARYRNFGQSWRRYLESPLPARPRAPQATRPVAELVRSRSWRLYRHAVREGRDISPRSPDPVLHRLRKTCKKLRYLMETFQTLYPEAILDRQIHELKRLQDCLGTFQDLTVQIQMLEDTTALAASTGDIPDRTRKAIHSLLKVLNKRRSRARTQFAKRFKRFAAAANRRRFRNLFKDAPEQST